MTILLVVTDCQIRQCIVWQNIQWNGIFIVYCPFGNRKFKIHRVRAITSKLVKRWNWFLSFLFNVAITTKALIEHLLQNIDSVYWVEDVQGWDIHLYGYLFRNLQLVVRSFGFLFYKNKIANLGTTPYSNSHSKKS